jgi:hypothetical protein
LTVTSEKARENRVRRMAARRGFRIVKYRRRDPLARDYGKYELWDESGPVKYDGDASPDLDDSYWFDLDEIEAFLRPPPKGPRTAKTYKLIDQIDILQRHVSELRTNAEYQTPVPVRHSLRAVRWAVDEVTAAAAAAYGKQASDG